MQQNLTVLFRKIGFSFSGTEAHANLAPNQHQLLPRLFEDKLRVVTSAYDSQERTRLVADIEAGALCANRRRRTQTRLDEWLAH